LNYSKAFLVGIILNVIYIVVEVVSGLLINSMALLADAGHNFSDVLGFCLRGVLLILLKLLLQKSERMVYENQQYSLLCSMLFY